MNKLLFFAILAVSFNNSAFAGLSHFTNNRDLTLTEDGPRVNGQEGYKRSTIDGRTTVSKEGYKLSVDKISSTESWTALEASRSVNGNAGIGEVQIARFKGAEIQSYTSCRGDDDKSAIQDSIGSRTIELSNCGTATKKVCATVSAYLGKNVDYIQKAIDACKNVGALQGALRQVMTDSEYKKIKSENTKDLSQAYYDLVRPSANIKNKMLDNKKTDDLTKSPENPVKMDPQDSTSLLTLANACAHLNAVQGEKYFTPPSEAKKGPERSSTAQ